MSFTLPQKILTEFIGTFFLSLTICTAAIHGSADEYVPFAIASTLMVVIYAGGHISGAHYNPAVTSALIISGKVSLTSSWMHFLPQFFGGVLAAYVYKFNTK